MPLDESEAGGSSDRTADDDRGDYYGFEVDPAHGRFSAAGRFLRRSFGWGRAAAGGLVWPFEAAGAYFYAFREAGLRQAPDRRVVDLLQAVPAVAVGVSAVGVAVAGWIEAGGREEAYRSAAAVAAERGDDEAVRVYVGRMFDLSGSPDSLYRVAEVEERMGRGATAEALMRRLAEEEGYGPAYFWLAERALAGAGEAGEVREAGRLEEATAWLRKAEAAGGVGTVELAAAMSQALLRAEDFAGAIPYLEHAAGSNPSARLELATAYARVGKIEEARRAAAAAEPGLRARVEADPTDRTARADWVTCLLNLGRPRDAVEALEGRPRDGVLGDLFVVACLASENEAATAGAPIEERLGWIERALEARPRSEPALLRLVELADDPAAGGRASRLLDESIAGGEVTPAVSVALGTRAWREGDKEAALRHLERAYSADPTNAVAANNVAWLLAERSGEGDLERALGIASDLVAKHPDAVHFRDTRGQVLGKLGRWDEALTDLELALSALRDSVDTRRALAEAYRRAGQKRLAELQDREADRLEVEKAAKGGSSGDADGLPRADAGAGSD